jgi:hypothetical protein
MEHGTCSCKEQRNPNHFVHPRLQVEAAESVDNFTGERMKGTVVIMPRRIADWVHNLEYLDYIEGDMHNFATLETTYEDRHEVKALGADYSPGMKKWIVAPMTNLQPFAKFHPWVHNRGRGDVVMYNVNLDLKSAVAAFLRCGFKAEHINIVGVDEEAERERSMLYGLLSKKKKIKALGKRALDSDSDDDSDDESDEPKKSPAANTHTPSQNSSKRPCFSDPESMQAFVRMSQEEKMGGLKSDSTEDEHMGQSTIGRHRDISSLLTTAKSALVSCNCEGSTSAQQMEFNEAIYNVIEAVASKLDSKDAVAERHSTSVAARVTPTRYDAYGNPLGNLKDPTI